MGGRARTVRRAATAAAVAVLGVLSTAPAAEPADYAAAAREAAAPWPARQRADGTFREYIRGHDPRNADDYGEAMLGYALLQVGIRDGDDTLVRAGLRALTHDARVPDADEPIRMFRNMAIVSAYNLARVHIPDHPEFARVRPSWERRLRQVRVSRLRPHIKVTNKALIEAVEVLELARSGIDSDVPGSVLRDPAAAVRLVQRLLDGRLPSVATGAGTLIGDAPDFPPAYHALSTGFVARAIELLGDRAPQSARRLLDQAVAASSALAGPDGDLAYTGRSQEQIWALSLTAYAAERALRPAVADRAIDRLRRYHRGGPAAFAITPSLTGDLAGGSRGVDRYASAVQYTGLGLVGLNWAHGAVAPGDPAAGIGADADGSRVIGRGRSGLATVRAGDVWFAVRQAPGGDGDLRYDFGLVALKVRAADGAWSDLLPIRPRSPHGQDSAGPVLRIAGREGWAEGRGVSVAPGGTVTVTGGFRERGGRLLRRGVRFRFVPLPCGVRVEWPARRGDRYEYSAFVRRGRTAGPAGDAVQELAYDPAPAATLERGYSSGTDARLTRVRLRFTARRARTLSVTTCARAGGSVFDRLVP
jgi:hypothetical protein